MEQGRKMFSKVWTSPAEGQRPMKGRGKLKLSPLGIEIRIGPSLTHLDILKDAVDLIASRIPPGRVERVAWRTLAGGSGETFSPALKLNLSNLGNVAFQNRGWTGRIVMRTVVFDHLFSVPTWRNTFSGLEPNWFSFRTRFITQIHQNRSKAF